MCELAIGLNGSACNSNIQSLVHPIHLLVRLSERPLNRSFAFDAFLLFSNSWLMKIIHTYKLYLHISSLLILFYFRFPLSRCLRDFIHIFSIFRSVHYYFEQQRHKKLFAASNLLMNSVSFFLTKNKSEKTLKNTR